MLESNLTGRQPVVLGLDLGTTFFKGVLLGPDGAMVASHRVLTPFVGSADRVEMSFIDMAAAINQLVHGLEFARYRVEAVGVASMAESGAVINPQDEVVTPILTWYDERGRPPAELLRRRFEGDRWAVLGRPIKAQSSIALLAHWVGQGAPVAKWLGVAELFAWMVSDEMVGEPSLAARSCAYDIVGDRYETEIIEAIGAPLDVFPMTRVAGAAPVRATTDFARALGLASGTPVTVAGHDHLVGALGAGATPGDLVDSLGTSELLLRYTKELPDLVDALAHGAEAVRAPGGKYWAVTLCPARSGVLLADLRQRLGKPDFDYLAHLAIRATTSEKEMVALPLPSEPLSHQDLVARMGELAQSADVSNAGPRQLGAIWARAIDDLAEVAKARSASLEAMVGKPERALFIGGGARNDYWVQKKRQLAGDLPVHRALVVEAVARGAALLAGAAGEVQASAPSTVAGDRQSRAQAS